MAPASLAVGQVNATPGEYSHSTTASTSYELPATTPLSSANEGTAENLLKLSAKVNAESATVLIDCGATKNFISQSFAQRLKLKTNPRQARAVVLADGSEHNSPLTSSKAYLRVGRYSEKLPFYVLPLTHCNVILGKSWLAKHNPQIDWASNTLQFQHKGEQVLLKSRTPAESQPACSLLLAALQFKRVIKRGAALFMAVLKPVKQGEDSSSAGYVSAEGQRLAVQIVNREFPDVFPDQLPPGLPPSRGDLDHAIPLVPGAQPVNKSPYRMSPLELDELKKQLPELLNLGFIQPSTSTWGAPVLFARKKGGALRLCVDHRALNKLSIRNACSLPRIDELLDRLHGAKVVSKLDLAMGYHQIRLKPEDVPKTAFDTRYGHFEFLVLSFGLTNGPATFTQLTQRIFKDVLDTCLVTFIDDLLVCSPSIEQYANDLRRVMQILWDNRLFARRSKCCFFQRSAEFVGFIVGADGISIDPKKVTVIKDWPAPATLTELRSFLGAASYHRRFIKHFSAICTPMFDLLKQGQAFVWGQPQQQSFQAVKQALCTAPVVHAPDPSRPYTIHSDASDFALGAESLQDFGNGLQPIAYHSRKLSAAEVNYPTHDKEMLAIIDSLRTWRHLVLGSKGLVLTDHNTLTFFHTQPNLSRRQARWMEYLAEYDVAIKYLPGKANVLADALSRRPGLALNALSSVSIDTSFHQSCSLPICMIARHASYLTLFTLAHILTSSCRMVSFCIPKQAPSASMYPPLVIYATACFMNTTTHRPLATLVWIRL